MSASGDLLERMEEMNRSLIAEGDERRHFHGTYMRTTRAVMEEAAAGRFRDPAWVERWGLVFAELYLVAFDAWERGDETAGPWHVAFEVAANRAMSPVRHALLGLNAHINYDLPQALLAVIAAEEFDDDAVMAERAADHAHVDSILARRVAEEDAMMARVEAHGDRTIVDRLMSPLNRAGTRRFLEEGRVKVWQNTRLLNRARREGPDVYAEELSRLEELCQDRVTDLVTSRFVIMRLAWHGFGVELSPGPPG